MRRHPRFALVLGIPMLAGCTGMYTSAMPAMPGPTRPGPYTGLATPMPYPMMTSAPVYPAQVSMPPLVADGPSMDDAYHVVHRYVTMHYAGAELVAARTAQVAPTGRIAKAGTWSFTYRASVSQQATSSTTIQAVEVPAQFESRQLTFRLGGNNDLFAPEVTEKAVLQPIDYARVLPLSTIVATCQSLGMPIGPGGVAASLVSDTTTGTYYEIDNGVGYIAATPAPYGSGSLQPAGSIAYGRLKYRLDAYTGDLLARLTP